MKKKEKTIYRIAAIIAGALFSIFMGLNLVSAFFTSSVCNNMTEQYMYTQKDNLLTTVLGMCVFVGLSYLVCSLANKKGRRFNRIFLICVLAEYLILGLFLILCGRTIPAADSGSVYWMGDTLARGSYSMISPDSYLSYYPQQIGLMSFFALLLKGIYLLPVNLAGFHFIKVIYVVICSLIVLVQYFFVGEVFEKEEIKALYLLFMAGNFYLIIYSNFLYGEIPALLLISVTMLFTARLYKNKGNALVNIIMIVLGLTLATFIRKNTYIFTIAYVIVVVLMLINKMNQKLLIALVTGVILSMAILPITRYYMESKAGNYLTDGVTAKSYLAMGMQEGGRASGWYNGYNFNLYTDKGFDTKLVNKQAAEDIKERMEYFKNNKDYAFDFYKDKYLSQWTDGTYASCQATLAEYGGRIGIVESLYTGELYKVFVWYEGIYQNMIYLGALIFSVVFFIKAIKGRSIRIIDMLPMICAFGGFLFHMIWEANSRYIFTYAVLIVVYGAAGLYPLFSKLLGRKNG